MNDAEIDFLIDVKDGSAVTEYKWEVIDFFCARDMLFRNKFDCLFEGLSNF